MSEPVRSAIDFPDPPLVATTFVLRPFRADDFDAAAEYGQDASSARWVPPLPAEDGAGVVAVLEEWRLAGELVHLVIAEADGDTYLGEVTLLIGEHQVGELGCGVVPAAQGRGLATEALALLAGWALDSLGIGRLQVFVSPENPAALRFVEKVGFRREGLLRDYWVEGGTRLDAVVLSLLPGDRREPPPPDGA